MRENGIKYLTTQNENIKVSPVERVIGTFRNKIFKLFQASRSFRYLEDLSGLVDSYNSTPHRSLPEYMSPSDVRKENEAIVWDHMYNDFAVKNTKPYPEFKFNIGDLVRLAFNKDKQFRKDWNQKWTSEIFKISETNLSQGFAIYKVIDFLNEPVIGTFYEHELQKVYKTEEALWIIEKVLKKRKSKQRIPGKVSRMAR